MRLRAKNLRRKIFRQGTAKNFLENSWLMDRDRATRAFAIPGHSGRMRAFRHAMRFAPQGMRPAEIAKALRLCRKALPSLLSD